MAQPELERLLLAKASIEEVMRPLTLLFTNTVETDSLRVGLQATAANGEHVAAAGEHAREALALLRPIAEGGFSRDVTRAVNVLEGVSWDRLDELFRSTTTSDPGDILRYQFARHAEVSAKFAEYAVQKSALRAVDDMIRAAS